MKNFRTFRRIAFEKISVFILTNFAFVAVVVVVQILGKIFGGKEFHFGEILE